VAFDLIIADPSPTMKKIFQLTLPEPQYRLHFASRLEEVWPLLETTSPELIIADQALFENSEELKEFNQKLRALGLAPLFLTGGLFDRLPGDYVQQLKPEKVLIKPFTQESLVAAVKETIEKKHVPDTLPEELPEVKESEIRAESEKLSPELRHHLQLLVRQEVLEAERELEKRIKASLLRELKITEHSPEGASEINKKAE